MTLANLQKFRFEFHLRSSPSAFRLNGWSVGQLITSSTPARETRPVRCAAILVYCSVRDWTRFCLHTYFIDPPQWGFSGTIIIKYIVIGFQNIRSRRSHVLGFIADLCFFPLWRAEYPDSLPNSRGCVWTEAVSGKKKVVDSKISWYAWMGLKISGILSVVNS